ncbi:Na+/H+ antiporter NhaA [Jejuia pallidilutea]|uniref:Na(+)/H(+) antiporter NhaA n=1 Tax=Jejuia pallidilutea TaxID=504487 RepID=A0A090VT02_9FLAO|nr:Na+/H+ antiporter NhaA [Jejuia pallidilutea]GAL67846.1 Na+/H+ antiporter NhaA type [Jejuia pallidilutea]GAL72605.1 Na+/H+ antiporter NhaA type [Jejuia pallidilutea]GAL89955.1 Na+/H+ antiporter NhaA type [Jejuia pallidilutea]
MLKQILLTPFQKFIKLESLAGVLLFGATIIALVWANSSYGASYESLLQYKIGISSEGFELKKPLILWINDGLMAIFFFLIGLELKRELLIGEINTLKKAAFPLVAALGGVFVPVMLFLMLNQDPSTTKAWGIPMATDIAFALAILGTLGKRVPLSLKIFLTAFAIIDDIAAVLVIAIFYSSNINWMFILIGLAIIGVLAILNYKWRYSLGVGLVLAVIVWFLFLKSGIHPTIAGVLLAFTIPIKRKIDMEFFTVNLESISNVIANTSKKGPKRLLTEDEINHIDHIDDLTFKVRSPLQHLEHELHSLTAYFILPVFAFANAGVVISTNYNFNFALMANIAISLFLGKLIGVTLFSYIGVKTGITELPSKVKFSQIVGIASIAGVGFTMSIFIDNLAFATDLISMNSAKVGIIIGSLTAGIVGYLILRFTSKTA